MRMVARPNTTVDVLRDTDADGPTQDVDEFGDEVETGGNTPSAVVYAGEPALIVEKTVRGVVDSDGREIRLPMAHLRPDITVRVGDRLRDASGALYSVDKVSQQRFSPTRLLDVRLELTRTS